MSMKVRVGFVTNSSSTSYLLVGVDDTSLIHEIINALCASLENKPVPIWNVATNDEWDKYMEYIGFWHNMQDDLEDMGITMAIWSHDGDPPHALGYNLQPMSNQESIEHLCRRFTVDMKRRLGVDIPISKVRLMQVEGNH
jgi:hypothetical protein